MSMSMAAHEAFELLNAAMKEEFRGYGDTKSAARDRAARRAGVTRAQAERIWKNWQSMNTVNGDVYRSLRNTYGHLCGWIERKAASLEREAAAIEEANAAVEGNNQVDRCMASKTQG